MSSQRYLWVIAWAALLGLAGCASRPVNPPITQVDPNGGYTFQARQKHFKSQDTLSVLVFSGGGTRAAAFSYDAGVLPDVPVAPNWRDAVAGTDTEMAAARAQVAAWRRGAP